MNPKTLSRPFFTAALPGLGCLLLAFSSPAAHAQAGSPAAGGKHADDSAAPSSRVSSRAPRSEEKFLMKAHASGMREIQLSQLAATRATDPRVRSYAQQLVSEHQQMAQDLKPLLEGAGWDKSMDSPMPMGGAMPGSDAMPAGSTDASAANRSSTSSTDAGANAGKYSTPGRPTPAAETTDTGLSSGGSSATGRSSDATRPGAMATAGTPDSMDGAARNRAPGALNNDENPGQMDKSSKSISGRWNRMVNDRKLKRLTEKTGADFDKAYINLMVDEHESAVDLFQDGADDNNSQVQMFAAKYLPKLREHLAAAEQLDKSLN